MGIKSIWDNPYYKNYKPMPKWAFSVQFNISNTGMGDTLNKAITNAVWGKKELSSLVPVYYAGVMANHPGRMTTAGELSFTFNENENLDISKILENIYSVYTFNEKYFENVANNEKNVSYKISDKQDRSITVIVYKPETNMAIDDNNKGTVAGRYKFYNCFPTNLEEVEMSYDSDEIVQRTIRFSYDYMIREE
jgi:hypothetical protein